MKKFLTVIFAALLAVASLAGCSGNNPEYVSAKDGEWIEVQSISYDSNTGLHTLVSKFKWDMGEEEPISQEEYQTATEDQEEVSIGGTIGIDRAELIKNLSQNIVRYRYIERTEYQDETVSYKTVFYKSELVHCNICYVKVRFLGDDIELNYCDYNNERGTSNLDNKTIRIKPLSYEITYFND